MVIPNRPYIGNDIPNNPFNYPRTPATFDRLLGSLVPNIQLVTDHTDPDLASESESEVAPEVVTEPETDEPEQDAEPEAEPKETDSDTEVAPEVMTEEANLETEPEAEPLAELKEAKSEAESESQVETVLEPNPEPDWKFPKRPKKGQIFQSLDGAEWTYQQPRNEDGTFTEDDPNTPAVESAFQWVRTN